MTHDLITKNIEFLKRINSSYEFKIDDDLYQNNVKDNDLIHVEYKEYSKIEVKLYDDFDSYYLLSLDKLFKEYCGIEDKKQENFMVNFLSKLQPNIQLKNTIENIKNIFMEFMNIEKIDFYINPDLKMLKGNDFNFISTEKIRTVKCLKNELYLPINLEDGFLGYFKLVKNQSFDLYDIYLIKTLEEHVRKNIENSFLENKFNIILDKSLKILTKILEVRVPGAEKHCENVLEYSQLIADKFGMTRKQKENLKYGSLLFDVGKIGVPENILNKKEKLTKEEKDEVRKHVNYGYELLSKIPAIPSEVREIVLYHHEKWDGSGYPKKLSKDEIPLSAQIIGILDKYVSLTEKRSYRKKLTKDQALNFLENYKGEYYNPKLVDKLKEVINDG